MVEMNRKSSPRVGGARKRTRLRSPSPHPSRNATPTPSPAPAPPPPNSTPAVAGEGQPEKAVEKKPLNKDTSLPATREPQNSVNKVDSTALKQQTPEETREVHMSASHPRPEPFKSSSLPEEKSNSGISASKTVFVSKARKRERTPSPTPYPNPKRSLLTSDGLPSSKLTSALQILRGMSSSGNHVKSPPPILSGGVAVSRVGNSSASHVLTEELHKQQGQENTKLKVLIVKEVRKHGKSECTMIVGTKIKPSLFQQNYTLGPHTL